MKERNEILPRIFPSKSIYPIARPHCRVTQKTAAPPPEMLQLSMFTQLAPHCAMAAKHIHVTLLGLSFSCLHNPVGWNFLCPCGGRGAALNTVNAQQIATLWFFMRLLLSHAAAVTKDDTIFPSTCWTASTVLVEGDDVISAAGIRRMWAGMFRKCYCRGSGLKTRWDAKELFISWRTLFWCMLMTFK